MATELSSTKVAGGTLRRVKHASAATNTDMVFALDSNHEGYAFKSRIGH